MSVTEGGPWGLERGLPEPLLLPSELAQTKRVGAQQSHSIAREIFERWCAEGFSWKAVLARAGELWLVVQTKRYAYNEGDELRALLFVIGWRYPDARHVLLPLSWALEIATTGVAQRSAYDAKLLLDQLGPVPEPEGSHLPCVTCRAEFSCADHCGAQGLGAQTHLSECNACWQYRRAYGTNRCPG